MAHTLAAVSGKRRLREARGPGVPGPYRQSKLRRKKISKDPARVTTRTQPGGMMAKTEPERRQTMRKLVLLLTAALALTACTAAPGVSSPAETAPPAETAATGEAAAFPVGTLRMVTPEVMNTGTASVGIPLSGLEAEPILKLDYATGVQTKLCDIDLFRQIPVAIMQHGDTVEYFWDSEGGTVFAHTAIRPDGSVEEQTIPEKFYPNFYDEYAAYDIWGTACKRLDWQTGKLTTASLPFVQLDGTCGAIGSKVLLTRVVSDTPLPEGEGNEEMRDAVLQNSLREYDLYDPATNTIEKVFDEPYYPEEHNELRSYLGYCGDKLYFGVTYTDSAAAFSTRNTLVSYDRTAGTWQEECSADSKGGEYSNFWPLLQDGQLRLVVLWRGTDTLTLYSIDNGARYEVPYEEAGSDATGNRNFPIALTDDGRILVTDGYIDRSGVAASRYALIDLGAYLAGSREYTAVEMWTE